MDLLLPYSTYSFDALFLKTFSIDEFQASFLKWFFSPVLSSFRDQSSGLNTKPSFLDSKSQQRIAFPKLDVAPSVRLSLIVPAFNEQERLPVMMDDTLRFLSYAHIRRMNLL
jgi:dolichyl-phosphate beta-glucosyltransferase